MNALLGPRSVTVVVGIFMLAIVFVVLLEGQPTSMNAIAGLVDLILAVPVILPKLAASHNSDCHKCI